MVSSGKLLMNGEVVVWRSWEVTDSDLGVTGSDFGETDSGLGVSDGTWA